MSVHSYETAQGTRYRVRWRNAAGKLQSKTLLGPVEASNFDAEIRVRKLRSEALPVQTKWTLDRAYDEWRAKVGINKARSTVEGYDSLWNAHVRDGFGAAKLSMLVADPELIEDHFAVLEGAGVGDSSRRKLLMIMSGVFRACVRWKKVPVNPVREMEKPRATPERIGRPFPPLITERIRAELLSSRRPASSPESDACLVSVMSYTGLRPQEALALRFSDIGDVTIGVERALPSIAGPREAGPTKTRLARDVPLPPTVRDDITRLRKFQGDPPSGKLIFSGSKGRPWTRSAYANWRSRVWRKAVERLADDPELEWLAEARPYDCRKSFVSLQLRAGRPPLDIATEAGHSPDVMFRHYARVIKELAREKHMNADEQIDRARALVKEQTEAALRKLSAESLKPPSQAEPSAMNLLYGERRPIRRPKG